MATKPKPKNPTLPFDPWKVEINTEEELLTRNKIDLERDKQKPYTIQYTLDDKSTYDVPIADQDDFTFDFASFNPTRKYIVDGREYTIKASQRKEFEIDFKLDGGLPDEQKKEFDPIPPLPYGFGSTIEQREEWKIKMEQYRRDVNAHYLRPKTSLGYLGTSFRAGLLSIKSGVTGIYQGGADLVGGSKYLDNVARDLNSQMQALGTVPEGTNRAVDITGKALQSMPLSAAIMVASIFTGGTSNVPYFITALSAAGSKYSSMTDGDVQGTMRYVDSANAGGIEGATERYIGKLGNIKGLSKAFKGMNKATIKASLKSGKFLGKAIEIAVQQGKGAGSEYMEEVAAEGANTIYDVLRGKDDSFSDGKFWEGTKELGLRAHENGLAAGVSTILTGVGVGVFSNRSGDFGKKDGKGGKPKLKSEHIYDKVKAKKALNDQYESMKRVMEHKNKSKSKASKEGSPTIGVDPEITKIDINTATEPNAQDVHGTIDLITNFANLAIASENPEQLQQASMALASVVAKLRTIKLDPQNASDYNLRLEELAKQLDIASGYEVNPAEAHTLVTPERTALDIEPEPVHPTEPVVPKGQQTKTRGNPKSKKKATSLKNIDKNPDGSSIIDEEIRNDEVDKITPLSKKYKEEIELSQVTKNINYVPRFYIKNKKGDTTDYGESPLSFRDTASLTKELDRRKKLRANTVTPTEPVKQPTPTQTDTQEDVKGEVVSEEVEGKEEPKKFLERKKEQAKQIAQLEKDISPLSEKYGEKVKASVDTDGTHRWVLGTDTKDKTKYTNDGFTDFAIDDTVGLTKALVSRKAQRDGISVKPTTKADAEVQQDKAIAEKRKAQQARSDQAKIDIQAQLDAKKKERKAKGIVDEPTIDEKSKVDKAKDIKNKKKEKAYLKLLNSAMEVYPEDVTYKYKPEDDEKHNEITIKRLEEDANSVIDKEVVYNITQLRKELRGRKERRKVDGGLVTPLGNFERRIKEDIPLSSNYNIISDKQKGIWYSRVFQNKDDILDYGDNGKGTDVIGFEAIKEEVERRNEIVSTESNRLKKEKAEQEIKDEKIKDEKDKQEKKTAKEEREDKLTPKQKEINRTITKLADKYGSKVNVLFEWAGHLSSDDGSYIAFLETDKTSEGRLKGHHVLTTLEQVQGELEYASQQEGNKPNFKITMLETGQYVPAEPSKQVEPVKAEPEAPKVEVNPTPEPTPSKYNYSIDDINKGDASGAYSWNSYSPEKRGERAREDYQGTMEDFDEWLGKQDLSETAKQEYFDYFKNKMIQLTNDHLSAVGNTASSAVTGPSGFNVARNRRKNVIANKKSEDLLSYPEYYKKKIEKQIRKTEDAKTTPAEKVMVKGLKASKGLSQSETGSSSPASERRKFIDYFANHLHEFDNYEEAKAIIDKIQEAEKDQKYKLITPTSNVFKLLEKKRVTDTLPNTEDYYKSDTVHAIRNRKTKRFQLVFDGKPEKAIHQKLKDNAFRWSPKEGAWQVYLTTSGKSKVDDVLRFIKAKYDADVETRPSKQVEPVEPTPEVPKATIDEKGKPKVEAVGKSQTAKKEAHQKEMERIGKTFSPKQQEYNKYRAEFDKNYPKIKALEKKHSISMGYPSNMSSKVRLSLGKQSWEWKNKYMWTFDSFDLAKKFINSSEFEKAKVQKKEDEQIEKLVGVKKLSDLSNLSEKDAFKVYLASENLSGHNAHQAIIYASFAKKGETREMFRNRVLGNGSIVSPKNKPTPEAPKVAKITKKTKIEHYLDDVLSTKKVSSKLFKKGNPIMITGAYVTDALVVIHKSKVPKNIINKADGRSPSITSFNNIYDMKHPQKVISQTPYTSNKDDTDLIKLTTEEGSSVVASESHMNNTGEDVYIIPGIDRDSACIIVSNGILFMPKRIDMNIVRSNKAKAKDKVRIEAKKGLEKDLAFLGGEYDAEIYVSSIIDKDTGKPFFAIKQEENRGTDKIDMDRLFVDMDAVVEELEYRRRDKELDEKYKISREKQEKEEKEIADIKQAKKDAKDKEAQAIIDKSPLIIDTAELEAKSPMAQGRINKSLNILVSYNGHVMNRRDLLHTQGLDSKRISKRPPTEEAWHEYFRGLPTRERMDIAGKIPEERKGREAKFKQGYMKDKMKQVHLLTNSVTGDEAHIPKIIYDLIIDNPKVAKPKTTTNTTEPVKQPVPAPKATPLLNTRNKELLAKIEELGLDKKKTNRMATDADWLEHLDEDKHQRHYYRDLKRRKPFEYEERYERGKKSFKKMNKTRRPFVLYNSKTGAELSVSRDEFTQAFDGELPALPKAKVDTNYDANYVLAPKSKKKLLLKTFTKNKIHSTGDFISDGVIFAHKSKVPKSIIDKAKPISMHPDRIISIYKMEDREEIVKIEDIVVSPEGVPVTRLTSKSGAVCFANSNIANNVEGTLYLAKQKHSDGYAVFGDGFMFLEIRSNPHLLNSPTKAEAQAESATVAYGSLKEKSRAINKVDRIAKKQKPKSLKGIHRNNIIKGFKESGHVDFLGRKICGLKDLYQLFQIHRSPYIEKTHVVYMKGNKIVGNTGLTSGLQAVSKLPQRKAILAEAKRLGANGFYIVHNHPSGNSKPSGDDIATTRRYAKPFENIDTSSTNLKFKGHMVMDHNEFSIIDSKSLVTEKGYTKHKIKNGLATQFRKSPNLASITSDQDMFFIGKEILEHNNGAVVFITLSSRNIVDGYEVFDKDMSPSEIIEKINKKLSEHGGRGAVVYAGSYSFPKAVFKAGTIVDVIRISRTGKEFGHQQFKNTELTYEDAADMTRLLWEDELNYTVTKEQLSNPYYKQIYDMFTSAGAEISEIDFMLQTIHGITWADLNADNGQHVIDVMKNYLTKLNVGEARLINRATEFTDIQGEFGIDDISPIQKAKLDKIITTRGAKYLRDAARSPVETVKIPFLLKLYGIFTDYGEYIAQHTGDQRLSEYANGINIARKVVEAEGEGVVRLVKEAGEFVKTKEDELLLDAYLQGMKGSEGIMSKPDLYKAAQKMKEKLDQTKGIIVVSRVFDAISGAITPTNRMFYTQEQQTEIDKAQLEFGDYWENQDGWEDFFKLIEGHATKQDFLDMDIDFDPSVFVIENYLPQFNNIQDALNASVLNEVPLEKAYNDIVAKEVLLRKERVRKGTKGAQSDVLLLYGKTLLRAQRLKFLDRLVRRFHKLAGQYLSKRDLDLLSNNLRHAMGQYEHTLLGTIFGKISGTIYKYTVVAKGTLFLKNLTQNALNISRNKDIINFAKAYPAPYKQLERLGGANYVTRIRFENNQRSSVSEMVKFTSALSEMISEKGAKNMIERFGEKIKPILNVVTFADRMYAAGQNLGYLWSDGYNRGMSTLFNLTKAIEAWKKSKGNVTKFLRDIEFDTFGEAKQLYLLRVLQSRGIEEFMHQYASTQTINKHFEYDRSMNSVYSNVENIASRMVHQFSTWFRGFTRNYVGSVNHLLKAGEYKKAIELTTSMAVTSTAISMIFRAIFGKLDEYIDLKSPIDWIKKALEDLFVRSGSYGFDTLTGYISTYSISRFLKGEPNLEGEVSNMALNATGGAVKDFLVKLHNGFSMASGSLYSTANDDDEKASKQARQSARYFLGAIDQLWQVFPSGKFAAQGVNVLRDKPLWDSKLLETIPMTQADMNYAYKQDFSNLQQEIVYFIYGKRGERIKTSSSTKTKKSKKSKKRKGKK